MTAAASKRSAAAGFALPGITTIPFPNGTNDKLSRWHGAFCYLLATDLPAPTIGWKALRRERVFKTQATSRAWIFSERI